MVRSHNQNKEALSESLKESNQAQAVREGDPKMEWIQPSSQIRLILMSWSWRKPFRELQYLPWIRNHHLEKMQKLRSFVCRSKSLSFRRQMMQRCVLRIQNLRRRQRRPQMKVQKWLPKSQMPASKSTMNFILISKKWMRKLTINSSKVSQNRREPWNFWKKQKIS